MGGVFSAGQRWFVSSPLQCHRGEFRCVYVSNASLNWTMSLEVAMGA